MRSLLSFACFRMDPLFFLFRSCAISFVFLTWFLSSLHFGTYPRQQALNALLQAAWMWADHTPNRPSSRKQNEGWNALDAQLGRNQHVLISIHLSELQFFLIGFAEPRKERGQYAARRAPVRCEFDNHRERGVENTLLKILVTY